MKRKSGRPRRVKDAIHRAIMRVLWPFCWLGHDFFNGGETCRDCKAPRPPGWRPK